MAERRKPGTDIVEEWVRHFPAAGGATIRNEVVLRSDGYMLERDIYIAADGSIDEATGWSVVKTTHLARQIARNLTSWSLMLADDGYEKTSDTVEQEPPAASEDRKMA